MEYQKMQIQRYVIKMCRESVIWRRTSKGPRWFFFFQYRYNTVSLVNGTMCGQENVQFGYQTCIYNQTSIIELNEISSCSRAILIRFHHVCCALHTCSGAKAHGIGLRKSFFLFSVHAMIHGWYNYCIIIHVDDVLLFYKICAIRSTASPPHTPTHPTLRFWYQKNVNIFGVFSFAIVKVFRPN